MMTREEKVLKQLEEHKILVMADHGWDASTIEALNYVIAMLKDKSCEIRLKGEWLFQDITNAYYVTGQCSRCTQRNRINNFCPNCGADMRGEEKC